MEKNKTGRYLKYAIGEILLVVVGIVIALQINNWNTNRVDETNRTNYYKRIIVELDEETEAAMWIKVDIDSLIYKNKSALKIMESKNTDSIPVFKNLLGATATFWDVEYHFPILKEFINQNHLSKMKNDTLKMDFEYLSRLLRRAEIQQDYNETQYVNTIEPFFIKHINYSEVALPNYRKSLIQGGPSSNYEALLTNLELWNIITFKLESLTNESLSLESSIIDFKIIKERVEKELEK
ncbi:hypothetical protein [Rasiella sp. SM2506]|uniref:hypothetical protein n=1 Tax=Rasiella sp. SM2506 TaxID=3423914 RepID=UPI003D7A27E3